MNTASNYRVHYSPIFAAEQYRALVIDYVN